MTVMMFPGKSASGNNKYIDIVVSSLLKSGIDVKGWNKYKLLQTSNIFHVHWPELLIWLKNRKFRSIEGNFFIWNFFRTIQRVKRNNGVVVWTVHGLEPHDRHIKEDPEYEKLMKRFISMVDGIFVLTEAGREEIYRSFPLLRSKPWAVTQHPTYESVGENCNYDGQLREEYGFNEDMWVFALLGNLRPNKKADLAAKAFSELNPEKFHLILGGNASDSYQESLNKIVLSCKNITTNYHVLSDSQITKYYSISNALVFPSENYFNSGTIYTALSLNIPVVAARTRTNEDIQRKIGAGWMYLFEGEFSKNVVIEASRELVSPRINRKCDMCYFSPEKSTEALISGYRKILDYTKYNGGVRYCNE